MKKYFITGIGTGVGKTLVSSIMVEMLKGDYWKPVQTGAIEDSDRKVVERLISNEISKLHPESYFLKAPVSPHLASALENKKIELSQITLPISTSEYLVIEGAGGLLVPLGNKKYVIDIARKFDAEVILVCRNYLGCINHSLLGIDYLISNNFKIKGLVLNGNFDPLVQREIVNYADTPVLFEIPELSEVSNEQVSSLVKSIGK